MRVDVMNEEIRYHDMHTQRLPTEVWVVDDDGNASSTLSSFSEDLIMCRFKIEWIGPPHNLQKWKIKFPDADYYNHT